jgi:hypothetical protein
MPKPTTKLVYINDKCEFWSLDEKGFKQILPPPSPAFIRLYLLARFPLSEEEIHVAARIATLEYGTSKLKSELLLIKDMLDQGLVGIASKIYADLEHELLCYAVQAVEVFDNEISQFNQQSSV